MMDCGRFQSQFHPMVDGEVTTQTALALRFHAARCGDCESALASARDLAVELAAAGGVMAVPPADLVARIMKKLPTQPPVRRWLAWGVGGTAAAAGLAALGTLVVIMTVDPGSGPLFPGLRAIASSGMAWMGRFAALLEGGGWLTSGPAAAYGSVRSASTMPGLILLTLGLAGMAAALCLTGLRQSGPSTHAGGGPMGSALA